MPKGLWCGTTDGTKLLGRSRHKGEDNIKLKLEEGRKEHVDQISLV
jgi:hypothetical protein